VADSVIAEAIGAIDGVNQDFDAPSAYWVNTLFVYWNGKLQPKTDTNFGWTELGGTLFRLNSAPVVGDDIHVYYQTQPPTGGAFKQPPEMLSATHLVPKMTQAINLRPKMISAEEL
jgi:hypothetical protein